MNADNSNKTEVPDDDNNDHQVITYSAPWNIFSLAYSNKPQYPNRLGIGSFLPEANNYVSVSAYRFKLFNSTSPKI